MSEILRNFRAKRDNLDLKQHELSEHSNGNQHLGTLPPDYAYISRSDADEFSKRMGNIKIEVPRLPDEFDEVPQLSLDVTSKNDWEDGTLRGKNSITLSILPLDATVDLGRNLISHLTSGVSQKHVGSIFQIAYQLRRPGIGNTEYMFPQNNDLHQGSDIELSNLDTTVGEEVGETTAVIETGNLRQKAQGYAFLAASMLKMFTRSPENYDKSWIHINNGYKKFYSDPIPISGVTPSIGVLKQIHDHFHFAFSDVMKHTLYKFLYTANGRGEITNVQKYLYDVHLSHTGMHIVPIAYKICIAMNVTPKELLLTIYAKRFQPQILALVAVFELMQNTDDNHRRRMWKYGRIFDNSFLAPLQTRSCAKLCYLLACVIYRESAKANSGILNIRQFDEVSEEDKSRLMEGSRMIIRALKQVANGKVSGE